MFWKSDILDINNKWRISTEVFKVLVCFSEESKLLQLSRQKQKQSSREFSVQHQDGLFGKFYNNIIPSC